MTKGDQTSTGTSGAATIAGVGLDGAGAVPISSSLEESYCAPSKDAILECGSSTRDAIDVSKCSLWKFYQSPIRLII